MQGNESHQLIAIESSPSASVQTCEVRWPSIQALLEESTLDTFVLLDCPYFGSPATKRRGVLEILSGGSLEDYNSGPLRPLGFTKYIVDHLRRRVAQPFREPLTVAELHRGLCYDYPRNFQDWKHDQEFLTKIPYPLHVQVTSSSLLPSICLTPLSTESASHPISNMMISTSRLSITVDLDENGYNMDSLKEWARLIPTGAKSVTIHGPFPAAS